MHTKPGFELHGLQKLFATSISSINESHFLFNPDVIHEYVVGEVDRLKHRFLERVIAIDSEVAVQRYVRVHQYSLVAIMDTLYERGEEDLAVKCYDALEDLLVFIQERFPAYFDGRGEAPAKDIFKLYDDIKASFDVLENELMRDCCFPELVSMILSPLARVCTPPNPKISIHRVEHLKSIMEEAGKIGVDIIESDFDEPFIRLMLYLNYNSHFSFVEFTYFLAAMVPSDMETRRKIETLEFFLNIVCEAWVKPGSGYHPDSPSLKSLLTEYLTRELNSLRKIRAREEGDGGEW